jgi:hypothetical protein
VVRFLLWATAVGLQPQGAADRGKAIQRRHLKRIAAAVHPPLGAEPEASFTVVPRRRHVRGAVRVSFGASACHSRQIFIGSKTTWSSQTWVSPSPIPTNRSGTMSFIRKVRQTRIEAIHPATFAMARCILFRLARSETACTVKGSDQGYILQRRANGPLERGPGGLSEDPAGSPKLP